MHIRIVLITLILTFLSGASMAAEWVIERATRDVSVSIDGASWQQVRAGDAIPNAHWVRTGPRARVILAKGSERIMYRENTLAAISVTQPSGKKTKVTHQRGSILLAVKKRRRQHTSVVTPHLAAVVKGTVFEVTVARRSSNIRVDQGLVAVSDGESTVDVPAGRQATKEAGAPAVSVTVATETSIGASGQVGIDLAEVPSSDSAGGSGGGSTDNAGQGGNPSGSVEVDIDVGTDIGVDVDVDVGVDVGGGENDGDDDDEGDDDGGDD